MVWLPPYPLEYNQIILFQLQDWLWQGGRQQVLSIVRAGHADCQAVHTFIIQCLSRLCNNLILYDTPVLIIIFSMDSMDAVGILVPSQQVSPILAQTSGNGCTLEIPTKGCNAIKVEVQVLWKQYLRRSNMLKKI